MSDNNEVEQSASREGRALQTGVAVAILAFAALLFTQTFAEISAFAQASQGRGPFFYPRFIMAAIALFAILTVLRPSGVMAELPNHQGMRMSFGLIAIVALYVLGLVVLGFLLSSIAFALITPLFLGYRRLAVILAVAVVFSLTVWWLFESVFLIILPQADWVQVF